MSTLDWMIVILSIFLMSVIGSLFTRRAGRSVEDYFVSGRSLPWWIIGLSSVATYTDAGLSSAVTMWVYTGGLLGNMVWWIPFCIWMPLCTVIWSKLWRNLKTVTTAELLEVRYSGKVASGYRSIYAVFLSFGFVVVLMGYVSGWLQASLGPIMGWEPFKLFLVLGTVTAMYTMLGGQYGVAYSDAAQFIWFLASSFILVPIVIKAGGGWDHIYARVLADRGSEFFSLHMPNKDLPALTIVAFIVQGMFFAASPVGGEGFTAQRFMAAKNEFHAQLGQFFNTMLTLVVRVLPFLFIGIAAVAIVPQGSIKPENIWAFLVHDYVPSGLVGVIVAGILAAYMSTISTEMNWGASYIVNDVYRRVIKPDASPKHYVVVSRISSLLLFGLSLLVAYFLVKQMVAWFLFINSVVFAFILPLSWLRFFWWRLNIYGEAAALIIGLPLGWVLWFPMGFADKPFWQGFLLLFGAGFLAILLISLITRPEEMETLKEFYLRCHPPGLWGPVRRELGESEVKRGRYETVSDIIDSVLGIALCGGWLMLMLNLFARQYLFAVMSIVITLAAATLFILRWARRGVFKSL